MSMNDAESLKRAFKLATTFERRAELCLKMEPLFKRRCDWQRFHAASYNFATKYRVVSVKTHSYKLKKPSKSQESIFRPHVVRHEVAEPKPAFGLMVETCKAYGISRTTAFMLASDGLIDTFLIGKRRYVLIDSINTLPSRIGGKA